jgi:hypothetical protein
VAFPLINLFVEACHVIFMHNLDKNIMPYKRRSSFEVVVLKYTLDNTLHNNMTGIDFLFDISANGFQDQTV